MGFLWNFPISRRRRRSCHQRILLKLGRSARDSRRLARRFLQGLNLGFRMVKHTWKPMTYWDLRRFNKVNWGLTKVSQGLAIQKLDLNQEQSGFSQQTSGYLWKSDDFVQHSVWIVPCSVNFLTCFSNPSWTQLSWWWWWWWCSTKLRTVSQVTLYKQNAVTSRTREEWGRPIIPPLC